MGDRNDETLRAIIRLWNNFTFTSFFMFDRDKKHCIQFLCCEVFENIYVMKKVTKLITRTEKYELGNRLSSRVIKLCQLKVLTKYINHVYCETFSV